MYYIGVVYIALLASSVNALLGGSPTECSEQAVNDEPTDWSEFLQAVGAIVKTSDYDTNKIKYYVMTPSSSPKYVNPNGGPFDWSSTECAGKPVLFNCHGWRADGNETWVHDLLSTFVKEYGGCGVSSDYSEATINFNYFAVVCETNNIAQGLAKYVKEQICKHVDCREQLYLHGHSLGAHTCGVAGALLKEGGIIVPRMIGSDAAGPVYNAADPSDASVHLSTDSAATVINVKTSCLEGSSRSEWAHQQQVTGSCTCSQNQCPDLSSSCKHGLAQYMVRSTMQKNFEDIKLKKIEREFGCLYTQYSKPPVEDSLGWKSAGKPGVFRVGALETCLDLSNSMEKAAKRRIRRNPKLQRKMKARSKSRKH